MGASPQGGIDSHLDAIRLEVAKWLDWETKKDRSEVERDEFLLNLAVENQTPPELVEIYSLILESRRCGLPIFAGSIMEMPYIFRLEYNAALDGETEHHKLLAANLAIRQRYANRLPK